MNVASTINQVKVNNNELKIGAVDNSAKKNGANDKSNSNAAAAQSAAVKTDSVELSQNSIDAAKAGNASNGAETQKTTGEKTQESKAQKLSDTLVSKQHELSSVVKDLQKSGVDRKEIRNAVKTANREVNKTIGKEIKQAYKAYREKKIDKNEFANRLYGTAVKKLDGIVSALNGLRDKKAASAENNTVAALDVKETAQVEKVATKKDDTKETTAPVVKAKEDNAEKVVVKMDGEDKKAKKTANNGNGHATTPPGLVKKEAVPPVLAKTTETIATATTTETRTLELLVKEEKVVAEAKTEQWTKKVNDTGTADNAFGQIVDFLNGIDKMVNGFTDKEEDEVSDGKDNGQGIAMFASKLNKMFSGINKAFDTQSNGGNVASKLGMAQVNKGAISRLFGGDGASNGSGKINSVGRDSEKNNSPSFNAVRFMSSLSSGMNSALDKYKEVQDIMAKKSGVETDNSIIA